MGFLKWDHWTTRKQRRRARLHLASVKEHTKHLKVSGGHAIGYYKITGCHLFHLGLVLTLVLSTSLERTLLPGAGAGVALATKRRSLPRKGTHYPLTVFPNIPWSFEYVLGRRAALRPPTQECEYIFMCVASQVHSFPPKLWNVKYEW